MEKKYPYDDGYFVNNALVTITGKGNYDGIGWEYYTVRANYKAEKTDQKKDNTTEKKTQKSNQKGRRFFCLEQPVLVQVRHILKRFSVRSDSLLLRVMLLSESICVRERCPSLCVNDI